MPSRSSWLRKGYLPLRIALPSSVPGNDHAREDTFVFIKEHRASSSSSSLTNRTLFLANAPLVPNVRTSLFIRSIFGRYGDVENVTVIRNPRDIIGNAVAVGSSLSLEAGDRGDDAKTALVAADKGGDLQLFNAQSQMFGDPLYFNLVDPHNEGKFAHITFISSKAMKRALKALENTMSGEWDGDIPPAVKVGSLELQELVDASEKLLQREAKGVTDAINVEELDLDDNGNGGKTRCIHAIANRQRSAYLKRRRLMEACNTIMVNYEEIEDETKRRAREAASQPDDDGFVTVMSSNVPAVGGDFEAAEAGEGGRRKGSKRKRKEKKSIGSSHLKDFYRFQNKESKKRGVLELRERFEADLAKVKKLKEEKMYRPFSS